MSQSYSVVNFGNIIKKYGANTTIADLRRRLKTPDLYIVDFDGVEYGDAAFQLELGATYVGHFNEGEWIVSFY